MSEPIRLSGRERAIASALFDEMSTGSDEALELAFELVSLRGQSRALSDANESLAFWKAQSIAANTHIRGLRKALEHALGVVYDGHEKENCAACQEAQRLLTDEWS